MSCTTMCAAQQNASTSLAEGQEGSGDSHDYFQRQPFRFGAMARPGLGRIRMMLPLGIALAAVTSACAADVVGMITVKQRLTHPSITPPVSMYERGPAVGLGTEVETDPLAAERARVVIWIEGNEQAAGKTTASMRQENRRFDPDIVVVPVGSTVSFPNMDPIFHNVFSLSKAKSFDLGNYPKGETRTVVFPRAGIVYVNCRLHPNMAGVLVVTPNRWYAKAARDGQFALHDVPAGTYTVVAWHKSTGFIRREIQVVEGRDTVVNFLVPIDAPGASGSAEPETSHMTGMSGMKAASR